MFSSIFKNSILILSVLFISGCSTKNPIIDSSFGISSEFEVKSSLINSSQIKLIAVNGLSPITNVGEIYFLHPSRGAQNALMIDLSDQKLAEKDFYIQTIKYKNEVSNDTLLGIKSNLLTLDILANKILEDKVSLYQYKDELEKAKSEDEAKIKESITLLQNSIFKLNTEYKTTSEKLITDMKSKDIFIFRWNTNDENKTDVTLSGLSKGEYSKKEGKSGYVLASGVSVEKLVPTIGFLEAFENNINNSSFSSWWKGRIGIVTYALKVKNLVSFVSNENERLAKLELTLKNISKFSSELKSIAKVDLNISSLSTALLSSSSQYSAPSITSRKTSIKNVVTKDSDGGTILTVITEGFNIKKNFLEIK